MFLLSTIQIVSTYMKPVFRKMRATEIELLLSGHSFCCWQQVHAGCGWEPIGIWFHLLSALRMLDEDALIGTPQYLSQNEFGRYAKT